MSCSLKRNVGTNLTYTIFLISFVALIYILNKNRYKVNVLFEKNIQDRNIFIISSLLIILSLYLFVIRCPDDNKDDNKDKNKDDNKSPNSSLSLDSSSNNSGSSSGSDNNNGNGSSGNVGNGVSNDGGNKDNSNESDIIGLELLLKNIKTRKEKRKEQDLILSQNTNPINLDIETDPKYSDFDGTPKGTIDQMISEIRSETQGIQNKIKDNATNQASQLYNKFLNKNKYDPKKKPTKCPNGYVLQSNVIIQPGERPVDSYNYNKGFTESVDGIDEDLFIKKDLCVKSTGFEKPQCSSGTIEYNDEESGQQKCQVIGQSKNKNDEVISCKIGYPSYNDKGKLVCVVDPICDDNFTMLRTLDNNNKMHNICFQDEEIFTYSCEGIPKAETCDFGFTLKDEYDKYGNYKGKTCQKDGNKSYIPRCNTGKIPNAIYDHIEEYPNRFLCCREGNEDQGTFEEISKIEDDYICQDIPQPDTSLISIKKLRDGCLKPSCPKSDENNRIYENEVEKAKIRVRDRYTKESREINEYDIIQQAENEAYDITYGRVELKNGEVQYEEFEKEDENDKGVVKRYCPNKDDSELEKFLESTTYNYKGTPSTIIEPICSKYQNKYGNVEDKNESSVVGLWNEKFVNQDDPDKFLIPTKGVDELGRSVKCCIDSSKPQQDNIVAGLMGDTGGLGFAAEMAVGYVAGEIFETIGYRLANLENKGIMKQHTQAEIDKLKNEIKTLENEKRLNTTNETRKVEIDIEIDKKQQSIISKEQLKDDIMKRPQKIYDDAKNRYMTDESFAIDVELENEKRIKGRDLTEIESERVIESVKKNRKANGWKIEQNAIYYADKQLDTYLEDVFKNTDLPRHEKLIEFQEAIDHVKKEEISKAIPESELNEVYNRKYNEKLIELNNNITETETLKIELEKSKNKKIANDFAFDEKAKYHKEVINKKELNFSNDLTQFDQYVNDLDTIESKMDDLLQKENPTDFEKKIINKYKSNKITNLGSYQSISSRYSSLNIQEPQGQKLKIYAKQKYKELIKSDIKSNNPIRSKSLGYQNGALSARWNSKGETLRYIFKQTPKDFPITFKYINRMNKSILKIYSKLFSRMVKKVLAYSVVKIFIKVFMKTISAAFKVVGLPTFEVFDIVDMIFPITGFNNYQENSDLLETRNEMEKDIFNSYMRNGIFKNNPNFMIMSPLTNENEENSQLISNMMNDVIEQYKTYIPDIPSIVIKLITQLSEYSKLIEQFEILFPPEEVHVCDLISTPIACDRLDEIGSSPSPSSQSTAEYSSIFEKGNNKEIKFNYLYSFYETLKELIENELSGTNTSNISDNDDKFELAENLGLENNNKYFIDNKFTEKEFQLLVLCYFKEPKNLNNIPIEERESEKANINCMLYSHKQFARVTEKWLRKTIITIAKEFYQRFPLLDDSEEVGNQEEILVKQMYNDGKINNDVSPEIVPISKLEETKYVTKNMYYESSNKLINNGQPKTMYSKSIYRMIKYIDDPVSIPDGYGFGEMTEDYVLYVSMTTINNHISKCISYDSRKVPEKKKALIGILSHEKNIIINFTYKTLDNKTINVSNNEVQKIVNKLYINNSVERVELILQATQCGLTYTSRNDIEYWESILGGFMYDEDGNVYYKWKVMDKVKFNQKYEVYFDTKFEVDNEYNQYINKFKQLENQYKIGEQLNDPIAFETIIEMRLFAYNRYKELLTIKTSDNTDEIEEKSVNFANEIIDYIPISKYIENKYEYNDEIYGENEKVTLSDDKTRDTFTPENMPLVYRKMIYMIMKIICNNLHKNMGILGKKIMKNRIESNEYYNPSDPTVSSINLNYNKQQNPRPFYILNIASRVNTYLSPPEKKLDEFIYRYIKYGNQTNILSENTDSTASDVTDVNNIITSEGLNLRNQIQFVPNVGMTYTKEGCNNAAQQHWDEYKIKLKIRNILRDKMYDKDEIINTYPEKIKELERIYRKKDFTSKDIEYETYKYYFDKYPKEITEVISFEKKRLLDKQFESLIKDLRINKEFKEKSNLVSLSEKWTLKNYYDKEISENDLKLLGLTNNTSTIIKWNKQLLLKKIELEQNKFKENLGNIESIKQQIKDEIKIELKLQNLKASYKNESFYITKTDEAKNAIENIKQSIIEFANNNNYIIAKKDMIKGLTISELEIDFSSNSTNNSELYKNMKSKIYSYANTNLLDHEILKNIIKPQLTTYVWSKRKVGIGTHFTKKSEGIEGIGESVLLAIDDRRKFANQLEWDDEITEIRNGKRYIKKSSIFGIQLKNSGYIQNDEDYAVEYPEYICQKSPMQNTKETCLKAGINFGICNDAIYKGNIYDNINDISYEDLDSNIYNRECIEGDQGVIFVENEAICGYTERFCKISKGMSGFKEFENKPVSGYSWEKYGDCTFDTAQGIFEQILPGVITRGFISIAGKFEYGFELGNHGRNWNVTIEIVQDVFSMAGNFAIQLGDMTEGICNEAAGLVSGTSDIYGGVTDKDNTSFQRNLSNTTLSFCANFRQLGDKIGKDFNSLTSKWGALFKGDISNLGRGDPWSASIDLVFSSIGFLIDSAMTILEEIVVDAIIGNVLNLTKTIGVGICEGIKGTNSDSCEEFSQDFDKGITAITGGLKTVTTVFSYTDDIFMNLFDIGPGWDDRMNDLGRNIKGDIESLFDGI